MSGSKIQCTLGVVHVVGLLHERFVDLYCSRAPNPGSPVNWRVKGVRFAYGHPLSPYGSVCCCTPGQYVKGQ